MIIPEFDFYIDKTKRRFQFLKNYGITSGMFSRNDQSLDSDSYIELVWRPIISITDDSNVEDIGVTDNGIFSAFRKRSPFIIEWNQWFHHLDKSLQLLYNDPVNSMDSAKGDIDISSDDTALVADLKDRIGNLRIGLNREIKHFGGTLTIDEIDDLNGSGLTEFPFFPPVQADFSNPEYFSLTTTKSGFKRYLRSSTENTSKVAKADREHREVKELTGYRTVIADMTNFTSLFPSSSDTVNDNIFAEIKDIEAIMDSAYTSDTNLDILGTTFLPKDKDYEIINLPAQTSFKMDGTSGGFELLQLDTDLKKANFKSKIYSENDGSWHIENNAGDLKIDFDATNEEIILTAGSNTITMTKGGNITIVGDVTLSSNKITADVIEATTKVITPVVSDS